MSAKWTDVKETDPTESKHEPMSAEANSIRIRAVDDHPLVNAARLA